MLIPKDVVEKLAECAANDFMGAKAVWSGRLSVATWTVVVGLLLELPELIYDAKHIARQRIDRFKYRVVVIEERVQIAKLVAFIGWFLVIGGVYGEVHTGDKLDQLNSNIQVCSDAKVQAATIEAGEAIERASSADLARVKIEAQVAWRRLSEEQKRDMAQHLRPHSLAQITVWFVPGDAEGSSFANDIAGMLRITNPYVFAPRPVQAPTADPKTVVHATEPLKPWVTGIEVASTDDSPSKSLADAIRRELNDCGFDAETIESNAPASLASQLGPNVMVQVASRPNGPQGEAKLRAQAEKNKQAQSNHDPR
jgi:hypothetical protein